MNAGDARLLKGIAQRIKELRLQRGLTAKEAAKRSWLSLRFYHHLEAGTANVSITKLSSVATMLNVPIAELLHREPRPVIALIGLRGAGKSTVGPRLAKALDCKFIELDSYIEQAAALPLSKIFTLHGDGYYRKLEAQCLNRILSQKTTCVIELPGGIVKNESAFDLVRTLCTTIWLKAKPEDHMNRVYLQGDTRPMANRKNAMDELREILREREPLYGLADIMVDTSSRSIKETLKTILDKIPKKP